MEREAAAAEGFMVSQWEPAPGTVAVVAWHGVVKLSCSGEFDI
jgi:hypothetical protein